jgi:hypothetical protein
MPAANGPAPPAAVIITITPSWADEAPRSRASTSAIKPIELNNTPRR